MQSGPLVGPQHQQPGRAEPVRLEIRLPVVPGRVGRTGDRSAVGGVGGQQQVLHTDHPVHVHQLFEDVGATDLGAQLGGAQAVVGEQPVAQLGAVEQFVHRHPARQCLVARDVLDGRIEVALDLVPDGRLDELEVGVRGDLDVRTDGDVGDLDQVDAAEILVQVPVRREQLSRLRDRVVDDAELAAVGVDEAGRPGVGQPLGQVGDGGRVARGAVTEDPDADAADRNGRPVVRGHLQAQPAQAGPVPAQSVAVQLAAGGVGQRARGDGERSGAGGESLPFLAIGQPPPREVELGGERVQVPVGVRDRPPPHDRGVVQVTVDIVGLQFEHDVVEPARVDLGYRAGHRVARRRLI